MFFVHSVLFLILFFSTVNLYAAGFQQQSPAIQDLQFQNIKKIYWNSADLEAQARSLQGNAFYLSILSLPGTCTQTILRVNPNDASSGRNNQNIRTTLQSCMNQIRQDYWGQDSCPERAYRYDFTFDNPPLLSVKLREVLSGVNLGERACRYNAWLESRADFKQVVFWEEWTPEEKRAFFNFIRHLHRGQEFGLRQPWDGPSKTRENCQIWMEPSFYPSPSRNQAARMTDPGGCKDWRGSPPNYTDSEIRLSWVGRAALSAYLTVSARVAWDLTQDPQKLAMIFPSPVWTRRPDAEGYMTSMKFADASKVFYFYVRNGILDRNSQWKTLYNFIKLGKEGQPVTGLYKFRHGSAGCGHVPREVVDAKTAAGQPILNSDFIDHNAVCEETPFAPWPNDFDFYMRGGVDDGCTEIGRRFFHSLNFLNIPTKYNQYYDFNPARGRAVPDDHAYSTFHLDSGTYGLGHNDDLYDSRYRQLPVESIFIEDRYFPRLYRVYDSHDSVEAGMELPYCLALLNHISQRCCMDPTLEAYQVPDQNFCRSQTYTNRILDAQGNLVSNNLATIELLTAEEYQQFLQNLQNANRLCQGPDGDPQPDDRSRPGCLN